MKKYDEEMAPEFDINWSVSGGPNMNMFGKGNMWVQPMGYSVEHASTEFQRALERTTYFLAEGRQGKSGLLVLSWNLWFQKECATSEACAQVDQGADHPHAHWNLNFWLGVIM